ncbi:putative wrky transcription factor 19, partial [Quercus suber]
RIQCRSLTHMNFCNPEYIRKLLDLLSATPNVKNLDLHECTKLVMIHDSIGYLDKLENWDLQGCFELHILPSCIVMKSLKTLVLRGCKRVGSFPDIPQGMENLKYLNLAHTAITELPPSIGNLVGLEMLEIGSSFYLCHLPISIYELQHISHLFLYGNVQFPKSVGIGRQASLNILKKLTSCFTHSDKTKDLNQECTIRFNRLNLLVIQDYKFLKEIPKLPEGTSPSLKVIILVNFANTFSRFAKLQFLKILNCMQFGRKLGLPQDMKCSSVKIDLHSHHKLSHQIDFSSQISISKLIVLINESFPTLDVYLACDLVEVYDIRVPGKKIPNWFNHQSTEIPLKDSYADNDSYGFVRDDKISWVCDLIIFINGHKRPFIETGFFRFLRCDHMWFLGMPHSQLQRRFGDLMQGDQNHVEISCKISHWTSEFGKFAPMVAGIEVHVECIFSPHNSVIIQDNSQNVDDSEDTMLTPLLPPCSISNGQYPFFNRNLIYLPVQLKYCWYCRYLNQYEIRMFLYYFKYRGAKYQSYQPVGFSSLTCSKTSLRLRISQTPSWTPVGFGLRCQRRACTNGVGFRVKSWLWDQVGGGRFLWWQFSFVTFFFLPLAFCILCLTLLKPNWFFSVLD